MSVAKTIEISAKSPKSFEDAIRVGLDKAKTTVDGIQGAWVKEQKVHLEGGKIVAYRVQLKVTFKLN